MPTEELENALRSAFARAAADFPDPEQARQRLLARDYRPGRGHRKLGTGITTATAAGAVVLGLGLSGVFGPAPARGTGTGTIRTTAFTLVKNANGTVTLASNLGVFLEPGILQRDLRQDGIPAIVTTGSFCSSDPSPAGFNRVMVGPKHSDTVTINPAAISSGTELSFGYFQSSSRQETAMGLVNTNSYTCTSITPTTPPRGSDAMLVHSTPGAKGAALPFPFPKQPRSWPAGAGRAAAWARP